MLVLFLLVNILFVGLGWPLYMRRVKPNNWYGLRVGETMEDERVWYAANAYSGRDFIVLGAFGSALAVGLWPVFGAKGETYGLVNAVFMTVGALVVCARGMGAARDFKKRFAEDSTGGE